MTTGTFTYVSMWMIAMIFFFYNSNSNIPLIPQKSQCYDLLLRYMNLSSCATFIPLQWLLYHKASPPDGHLPTCFMWPKFVCFNFQKHFYMWKSCGCPLLCGLQCSTKWFATWTRNHYNPSRMAPIVPQLLSSWPFGWINPLRWKTGSPYYYLMTMNPFLKICRIWYWSSNQKSLGYILLSVLN